MAHGSGRSVSSHMVQVTDVEQMLYSRMENMFYGQCTIAVSRNGLWDD